MGVFLLNDLLHESIPFTAGGAFPQPFGGLNTTRLTNENGFGLAQILVFMLKYRLIRDDIYESDNSIIK